LGFVEEGKITLREASFRTAPQKRSLQWGACKEIAGKGSASKSMRKYSDSWGNPLRATEGTAQKGFPLNRGGPERRRFFVQKTWGVIGRDGTIYTTKSKGGGPFLNRCKKRGILGVERDQKQGDGTSSSRKKRGRNS